MVLNLKVFKKLILIVFALVVFGLSSCNDETDDGSGIYSSITEKCKLEKSYLGKDFFDQGIEKATLVNLSDGDTASFKLSDGEYCTAGSIIYRQRGTVIFPGTNVKKGGDDTLFATVSGYVKYERKGRDKKQVSVYVEK